MIQKGKGYWSADTGTSRHKRIQNQSAHQYTHTRKLTHSLTHTHTHTHLREHMLYERHAQHVGVLDGLSLVRHEGAQLIRVPQSE